MSQNWMLRAIWKKKYSRWMSCPMMNHERSEVPRSTAAETMVSASASRAAEPGISMSRATATPLTPSPIIARVCGPWLFNVTAPRTAKHRPAAATNTGTEAAPSGVTHHAARRLSDGRGRREGRHSANSAVALTSNERR